MGGVQRPRQIVHIAGLKTDARQAYVDLRERKVVRTVVLDGTQLTVGGQDIFRQNTQETREVACCFVGSRR